MIIEDITTLKKYVPTVETVPFEKVKPHIITAESKLKTEILGEELFARTDESDELRELCERYVCLRAYERAIPFLDLKQTEQGFAVINTEGFVPASRERVKSLVEAAGAEGDDAEESLLAWLEALPSASELKEAWMSSPVCTYLTDTYISTLKEYRRYAEARVPVHRREFADLRGAMRASIRFSIVPVISPEQNDELLEQLKIGELNEANTALLEPLRFALAAFVSGQSIRGEEYMRPALSMLKAAADDFPAWRDSAIGVAELSRKMQANEGPIFFGGI